MGELYNPYPKLPKNIRQIGERDQTVRLYLEDYVNTYLKRLYPKGGEDLRVGVLLGLAEEHDGVPYLFVDGALEMEDVTEHGEKVVMNEMAWKKTYQTMEEMFPKRTVLGWFLCGAPGAALSPLNYWKQHSQYFPGKYQLMYLNAGLDGEEAVYVTSEDGFYKLRGHSIYYERNQMMQDYMIMRKDARRVESGGGDSVIRDFRQRMDENRSQIISRRSVIRVLGTVCSALAVMVLAGGVVMFNNYERMREMESVLASVLPEGTVMEDVKNRSDFWSDGQAGEELVVEEAAGQVYPTLADETMSHTYPEIGDPVSEQETVTGAVKTEAQENGGAEVYETAEERTQGSNPAGTDGIIPGGNQTASRDLALEAAGVQVIDGRSYYKVQDGETLYGICLKLYGTGSKMDEICKINGLADENKIISGQKLILP